MINGIYMVTWETVVKNGCNSRGNFVMTYQVPSTLEEGGELLEQATETSKEFSKGAIGGNTIVISIDKLN
jgi:hypothetical protein